MALGADMETPKPWTTLLRGRACSWGHPKPLGVLQHGGRQESVTRWLRLEGTYGFIWSNLLLKQEHLQQVVQDNPDGFWLSPEGRLHSRSSRMHEHVLSWPQISHQSNTAVSEWLRDLQIESKHSHETFPKISAFWLQFFFSSFSLADKKLHKRYLLGLGNQWHDFTAPGEVDKAQGTRAVMWWYQGDHGGSRVWCKEHLWSFCRHSPSMGIPFSWWFPQGHWVPDWDRVFSVGKGGSAVHCCGGQSWLQPHRVHWPRTR